jgi:hypothetical protein
MRRFLLLTWPLWLAGIVLVSLYLRPSAAQERGTQERVQVEDMAALFPASTKAYAETQHVAAIAKEVRALLKGSCLDDMPGSLEKFRPEHARYYGDLSMIFSMFSGPEGFDELARLKGGAFAVIDMPKSGPRDPGNILGVLLTGDSNLPHIIARTALGAGAMRTAATVEGVRIYRERRFRHEKPPFEIKDSKKDDFRSSREKTSRTRSSRSNSANSRMPMTAMAPPSP